MNSNLFTITKTAARGITLHPIAEAHKSTLIFMHGLGDSAEGFAPVFASSDTPMEKSTRVRL